MSPSLFYLYAVVVDCGSLASPANGQVSLTTTTFGSTATYECDAGYVLVGGEETRTCQENGQWSGTAPSCICKFIYLWKIILFLL